MPIGTEEYWNIEWSGPKLTSEDHPDAIIRKIQPTNEEYYSSIDWIMKNRKRKDWRLFDKTNEINLKANITL